MKISKRLSLVAFSLIFIANSIFAQSEVISGFTNFRDSWMRPLYPVIVGIVLLGGALFNIGLIWGENKEWKTFFSKLGIYLLAVTVIVGIYEAVTAIAI
jgi:sterol desaturase/sphingolipid hydroxylase (fatty acid hydroxylase superfamily)